LSGGRSRARVAPGAPGRDDPRAADGDARAARRPRAAVRLRRRAQRRHPPARDLRDLARRDRARDPRTPAVAIADGVVNYEGPGFFADFLLGDDPDAQNQRLRDGFARLAAEVDFDHILLAHGPPIVGDGRERLRAFAAAA
jgi:hypothetical protein